MKVGNEGKAEGEKKRTRTKKKIFLQGGGSPDPSIKNRG